MTRPKPGRTPLHACFATVLLAFLGGCGAPSDATPDATADTDNAATAPSKPDASAVDADPSTAIAAAETGAKLTGRITLDGPPPERRVINMTKDAECIKLHGGQDVLDEAAIVSDDGGVKNAFVYVRSGAPEQEYPIPDEPYLLDQKECMYRPRVGGMRVGQRLLVSNDDPVTHNVRSYPIRNRAFNFGQPADSEPRERIFDQPEREVEIQCDIHPWMHAFIFIMDHPFFGVSGDDGAYSIEGLPPGEYTLAVWHEEFGKQQQEITVGQDDLGNVDFSFKP